MKWPTMNKISLVALVAIAAMAVNASATSRVVVTGSADLRVWIDDGYRAGDVYASYSDVALSISAARDCYATVFVVDTDGYLHVVHPFSRKHNAWVRGGVTYRYTARELGIDALYGRGVAYVFAVGSPVPFDYSGYSDGIFVGGYGYRVHGDPYEACRRVYTTILPSRCDWRTVYVSSARFYIGSWARYPSYLCNGHYGVHVHGGTRCDRCAHVYASYHAHSSTYGVTVRAIDWARGSNEDVVRPVKFKKAYVPRTQRAGARAINAERRTVSTASRTRVVSSERIVREAKRTRLNVSSRTVKSKTAVKSSTKTKVARPDSPQKVARNKEGKRPRKSR